MAPKARHPETTVPSFHDNIKAAAKKNLAFTQTVCKGAFSELVVISIPPTGELGEGAHDDADVILFIVEGKGEVIFGDRKEIANKHDAILVTAGRPHNSNTELNATALETRTGAEARGKQHTDELYIAMAIDLARDFLLRADADMQALFREVLAARSSKPQTAEREGRVERAIDFVLQWEGGNIQELTAGDDSGAPLLCSNCFRDEGLRLSSMRIGQKDVSKCPNCGSQSGMKLSGQLVGVLAQRFFVWGTIRRFEYGACPAVQFNKHQPTSVEVAPWLEPDLRLIEKTLQVGFFHYGRPQFPDLHSDDRVVSRVEFRPTAESLHGESVLLRRPIAIQCALDDESQQVYRLFRLVE